MAKRRRLKHKRRRRRRGRKAIYIGKGFFKSLLSAGLQAAKTSGKAVLEKATSKGAQEFLKNQLKNVGSAAARAATEAIAGKRNGNQVTHVQRKKKRTNKRTNPIYIV